MVAVVKEGAHRWASIGTPAPAWPPAALKILAHSNAGCTFLLPAPVWKPCSPGTALVYNAPEVDVSYPVPGSSGLLDLPYVLLWLRHLLLSPCDYRLCCNKVLTAGLHARPYHSPLVLTWHSQLLDWPPAWCRAAPRPPGQDKQTVKTQELPAHAVYAADEKGTAQEGREHCRRCWILALGTTEACPFCAQSACACLSPLLADPFPAYL
jgi:hypothetical protein